MRSSVSKSAEQGTKEQQKRVKASQQRLTQTPTSMWGSVCPSLNPEIPIRENSQLAPESYFFRSLLDQQRHRRDTLLPAASRPAKTRLSKPSGSSSFRWKGASGRIGKLLMYSVFPISNEKLAIWTLLRTRSRRALVPSAGRNWLAETQF